MTEVVVIISARSEWQMVKELLSPSIIQLSPYGEWFDYPINNQQVLFFQSGVGKVSSAGAVQYVIDKWKPGLLVNLGTCGGFQGSIQRGQILLVNETMIYDIFDQMGNDKTIIQHYTTHLDLSFLTTIPFSVVQSMMISADRDLTPSDIPLLKTKYQAIAADWESGAIAWVSNRNGVRCLILRGVSDLVGEHGGNSYGNITYYHEGTRLVMTELIQQLPVWLQAVHD